MSNCPNCQSWLNPNEDICEHCGMVVTVTILSTLPSISPPLVQELCPRCKGPRIPGVKFCSRCGFSYLASTISITTQPVEAVQAPTNQLAIGSILHNKYKIAKSVGEGGMGAVYLADDLVLKRKVIIKALLSDTDADLIAQGVKEREFLASIKHANIVSIYDLIIVGSQSYIVMEYVHGKTLDQILEEQGQPFDVPTAIKHIMGILPAFSYLAKLGLVYCDFKPQNVMLEDLKDGTQIVKLIDLGTVIKHPSRPGEVYGTHGFYAPEAVKTPSPETDLYSICRTLAYMVTLMDLANPLFGMSSSEQYKVFRDHPAFYRLLVKGTHAKPAQRFRKAEDLYDQLAGVLRFIVGGTPGVPASSRQFISGALTTTGKLGLRGEAALDETDQAIDLLRYGDLSLRNGNYASAMGFYKQASRNNPKSVDAHLRLAEVYIERGDFVQALAEVTTVQRMAPGNWKIAWYSGRLLEAQGKFAEAAGQYRELVADLPGELPPYQALARVTARLGDDHGAVSFYTDILRADPSNTDVIFGMTQSLLNLQRWDEAAKVLSGVSEASVRSIDAQLLLCDLYLQRIVPLTPQNLQLASQAVAALAGRTEDPRYYLARGNVYRAAWQLLSRSKQSPKFVIAGLPNSHAKTLRSAAEESYAQYLRREHHPVDREEIVRRKLEVAPWRIW